MRKPSQSRSTAAAAPAAAAGGEPARPTPATPRALPLRLTTGEQSEEPAPSACAAPAAPAGQERILTEALRRALARVDPTTCETWLDLVVANWLRRASEGSYSHLKEILLRIEGKPDLPPAAENPDHTLVHLTRDLLSRHAAAPIPAPLADADDDADDDDDVDDDEPVDAD